MTRQIGLVLAAVALLVTGLPARQGPPASAAIIGRTVDAASNAPLSGVVVMLSGAGAAPQRVMTDSEGRFAFGGLPGGPVVLTASKPGWSDGAYGRRRPNGPTQTLTVGEHERRTNVQIDLWKFGAIGGSVVDDAGEPVVAFEVRALRRRTISGHTRLELASAARTDDRGVFRIGGLTAGEYLLLVPSAQAVLIGNVMDGNGRPQSAVLSPANLTSGPMTAFLAAPAERQAFRSMFFPDAISPSDAGVIRLGAGEERTGADIRLQSAPAVSVSGTVIGLDGPAANLAVRLVPDTEDGYVLGFETAAGATDAGGAFSFTGVPPGTYAIRAIQTSVSGQRAATILVTNPDGSQHRSQSRVLDGPLSNEPPQRAWADQPITVGSDDIHDLVIQLRPGLIVSGRLEFDGSAPPPSPEQLQQIPIALEPVDGTSQGAEVARVDADGRFRSAGLPPGRYVVHAGGSPSGWTFAGAHAGNRDVADLPMIVADRDITDVVVMFTSQASGAKVSGTITSVRGPDPDASAIVFPIEEAGWLDYGLNPRRLRLVRADATGHFEIRGLPAGSYFVAAVPDAAADGWMDPATLERLSRQATRIDLADGETRQLALRAMEPAR